MICERCRNNTYSIYINYKYKKLCYDCYFKESIKEQEKFKKWGYNKSCLNGISYPRCKEYCEDIVNQDICICKNICKWRFNKEGNPIPNKMLTGDNYE